MPDCNTKVTPVINKTHTESINRSDTTVPNDFEKDTLSNFAKMPHRETSPIRGTTKFAAYDTKMAYTLFEALGYSPNGYKAKFHLHPRKRCANTPKTNENNIQP